MENGRTHQTPIDHDTYQAICLLLNTWKSEPLLWLVWLWLGPHGAGSHKLVKRPRPIRLSTALVEELKREKEHVQNMLRSI